MPFEFIDNSLIDRRARTRIRSHVMKDKNVGKTREAKQRAPRTRIRTTLPMLAKKVVSVAQTPFPPPSPQLGTGLSLCPFPGELTPRCRDLIYKYNSYQFAMGSSYTNDRQDILQLSATVNQYTLHCQAVDVSASIWIQYIFQDKAYFHQAVATSIKCGHSQFSKDDDGTESLRHLSRAICLLNNKIAGKEALSDMTIAAIVGLTGHERLQNQHQNAMIHFRGLQRIIELRGGIAGLMGNPHLADKIFRVDVELALYNGTTTQFSVSDIPSQVLSQLRNTIIPSQQKQVLNFDITRILNSDLETVLSDALLLTYVLNNHDKLPLKLNAYSLQQTIILISYRLIQISQLATSHLLTDVDKMIHLALTAFTTTIFLGFGNAGLKVPLLQKLLRELAQEYQPEDTECQKLLLWGLFMGNTSVFGDVDECWIIPKIREIILALDLRTWTDVKNSLSSFPWVDSVHGQNGRALWEKCEVVTSGVEISL